MPFRFSEANRQKKRIKVEGGSIFGKSLGRKRLLEDLNGVGPKLTDYYTYPPHYF